MSDTTHDFTLEQHFAQRLRAARCARGWSQCELGRQLGLSSPRASARVSRYERGTSGIRLASLVELARVLDVPVGYFFEDYPEPMTPEEHDTLAPLRL